MQAYCFRFYFLLVTVIIFVKMVQDHELRGTSEFIRYHSEVDIEPSRRDSECDNDCLDSSFIDEIYTSSRSGDYVDERFRLMIGENVRSFRSESKTTVEFFQRITRS